MNWYEKIILSASPYGCWMNPGGEKVDVFDQFGHDKMARQIVQRDPDLVKKLTKGMSYGDCMDILLLAGWARIVYKSPMIAFGFESEKLNSIQANAIYKLVKFYRPESVYISVKNAKKKFTVEDALEFLTGYF